MNDLTVIHASNGGFCVMDKAIESVAQGFTWHRMSTGYFYRNFWVGGKKKIEYLHRRINKTQCGFHTDHINGFRNDNTCRNLRSATPNQNLRQNTPKHRDATTISASRFKGVHRVVRYGVPENKWRANIGNQNLGIFTDEKEAAKAYNAAAKQKYGEFAYLNGVD